MRSFAPLLLLLMSQVVLAVEPAGFEADPNAYYRLTSRWQGDGKALQVVNDGKKNDQLRLMPTSDDPAQLWRIVPLPGGYFRLTTKAQGDDQSLDVVNDATDDKVHLAKTGKYTGQSWKLTPEGKGFYRLTTKWQGDGKSLDVVNDATDDKVHLVATGKASGQYWKITAVKPDAPTPATASEPTACSCTEEKVSLLVCSPTVTLRCKDSDKLAKLAKLGKLPKTLPLPDLKTCASLVSGTSCEATPTTQRVCTGACPAVPAPSGAMVKVDPKQAFFDAYAQRSDVSKRKAEAETNEKSKRSAWDSALTSLNALATNDDGKLGEWKTTEICAPVPVSVPGHCEMYAKECTKPRTTPTPPFFECASWRTTNVCLVWVPTKVTTKTVCTTQRYFDVTAGSAAKDLANVAKTAWEEAKTKLADVTAQIEAEATKHWNNRCQLAVDAFNGKASPELVAMVKAIEAGKKATDKEIEKQLKEATAGFFNGEGAKFVTEGARLKALVGSKVDDFRALFTYDNLCKNPKGLPDKLAALGLKPSAAVGFTASAAQPDPLRSAYASRGQGWVSAAVEGAAAEKPHFYMEWSYGGNMAAVLGVNSAFSIITDYKGNSGVYVTLGGEVTSDLSAAEGILVHFYPSMTKAQFDGPIDDLGSWTWEFGVSGGEVVVGGAGITYSGDFSEMTGFGVALGAGLGALPVAGTVSASYTAKLTDL